MANLRIAQLEDYVEGTALHRALGLLAPPTDEAARLHWQHVCVDNPARLSGRDLPPPGWVLEAEGKIVGFIGNIARTYRWQNRTLLAGAAHQLGVQKEYRTHTRRLAEAYFGQPHSDLLLATTTNQKATNFFLRGGASALPNASFAQVLFWVTNHVAFMEGLLLRKQVPAPFARMLAHVFDPAFRLESEVRRRRPGLLRPELEVAVIPLASVNAEFDELFERKVAEQPRLLASRRAIELKWIYKPSAENGAVTIITCRRAARLEGYLILRRMPVPDLPLFRAQIVDMLVVNEDLDVFDGLLAGAYDEARKQRCGMIELMGLSERLRARARAFHPFVRHFPSFPFFFAQRPATAMLPLHDQDAWYPTFFDGDSSF